MRIVCISDTHSVPWLSELVIPSGDVLVHAGDGTNSGKPEDIRAWLEWVGSQPHRHKIVIAGNHDWVFERDPEAARRLVPEGVTYLQDSGCILDGVRFWGSPWQPSYSTWAFYLPGASQGIRERWDRIPSDTDVVVTHTPPHGILDKAGRKEGRLGCEELTIRLSAIKPQLHIFGHVHEAHGTRRKAGTLHVNACVLDDCHDLAYPSIVVDLEKTRANRVNIQAEPSQ